MLYSELQREKRLAALRCLLTHCESSKFDARAAAVLAIVSRCRLDSFTYALVEAMEIAPPLVEAAPNAFLERARDVLHRQRLVIDKCKICSNMDYQDTKVRIVNAKGATSKAGFIPVVIAMVTVLGDEDWWCAVSAPEHIPAALFVALVAAEGEAVSFLRYKVGKRIVWSGLRNAALYPGSKLGASVCTPTTALAKIQKTVGATRKPDNEDMHTVCTVYMLMIAHLSDPASKLQLSPSPHTSSPWDATNRRSVFQLVCASLLPTFGKSYAKQTMIDKQLYQAGSSLWWTSVLAVCNTAALYMQTMDPLAPKIPRHISTAILKAKRYAASAIDEAVALLNIPMTETSRLRWRSERAAVLSLSELSGKLKAQHLLRDAQRVGALVAETPNPKHVHALSSSVDTPSVLSTINIIRRLDPVAFAELKFAVLPRECGGSYLVAETRWLQAVRAAAFSFSCFTKRQSSIMMPVFPVLLKFFYTDYVNDADCADCKDKDEPSPIDCGSSMAPAGRIQLKSALAWLFARLAPGVFNSKIFSAHLEDIHAEAFSMYALLPRLVELYSPDPLRIHLTAHIVSAGTYSSPMCVALVAFLAAKTPTVISRSGASRLVGLLKHSKRYRALHEAVTGTFALGSSCEIKLVGNMRTLVFAFCTDPEVASRVERRAIFESLAPSAQKKTTQQLCASWFKKAVPMNKKPQYDDVLRDAVDEYAENYTVDFPPRLNNYYNQCTYQARPAFADNMVGGCYENMSSLFSVTEWISLHMDKVSAGAARATAELSEIMRSPEFGRVCDATECQKKNTQFRDFEPCVDMVMDCHFASARAFGLRANESRRDMLVVHPNMVPFEEAVFAVYGSKDVWKTELAEVALDFGPDFARERSGTAAGGFPTAGETPQNDAIKAMQEKSSGDYETWEVLPTEKKRKREEAWDVVDVVDMEQHFQDALENDPWIDHHIDFSQIKKEIDFNSDMC